MEEVLATDIPIIGRSVRIERERLTRRVALATLVIASLGLIPIAVMNPRVRGLAILDLTVLVLSTAVVAWLVRSGRQRLGAAVYLASFIGIISGNAVVNGGLRSPGMGLIFIAVMLAGVLLGRRSGVVTALIVAIVGAVLARLELTGTLPVSALDYDPTTRWTLLMLYLGLAVLVSQLVAIAVSRSLERAGAALAERVAAEQRLDQALDAASIGTFDVDLSTGRIVADARCAALLGLTPAADGSLSMADWRTRVVPEDAPGAEAILERLRTDAPRARIAYRYRHPDGSVRNYEAVAERTVRPSDGAISLIGTLLDLTESERAHRERAALAASLSERVKELRLLHEASRLLAGQAPPNDELLQQLVNRIPSAWLFVDDCGARIRYGDIDVRSPNWTASQWTLAAAFETSTGTGTIEVMYRSQHPTADHGPFLSEEREVLDSLADLVRARIEEFNAEQTRRAFEAELREGQKLHALGTLASGIAHDFNNILAAIGSNAELARTELQPDVPAAMAVTEILRARDRAQSLVKRILLFSRRQTSEQSVIALAPVVQEALALLRATLPKAIGFDVALDDNVPSVFADATQMHQIMMNLGTNAGFAMMPKGGVLTVRLSRVEYAHGTDVPSANLLPGVYVRLTVSDSGSGIDASVRERLFEPFFTTKGAKGTGLGLSVVHGIVRDHGGAVTVASELGVGTSFDIYLPATSIASEHAPRTATEPTRGNGQRLLYVDDDPSLARVIGQTLNWLGYQCTPFTDPREALAEFAANPTAVDAIISDYYMPEMDGSALATAVRAIRPELPFAISSGNERDDQLPALPGPPTHWLAKPMPLIEFSEAIARLWA